MENEIYFAVLLDVLSGGQLKKAKTFGVLNESVSVHIVFHIWPVWNEILSIMI